MAPSGIAGRASDASQSQRLRSVYVMGAAAARSSVKTFMVVTSSKASIAGGGSREQRTLRQAPVISRQPSGDRGAMASRAFERLPMPMAYFWLLLREFGGAPEAEAALLAGTGVAPGAAADPAAEGTLGQTLALIRNLAARLPAGWALTGGSAFHASTHGPLGFAAVSAPTL